MASGDIRANRGLSHHIAHRTRYRLPPAHRQKVTLENIKEHLEKLPGVTRVEINERTGSVLIHHEETKDIVLTLSGAIDEVAGDVFENSADQTKMDSEVSAIALLVRQRFVNFNARLAEATNNVIDLRMLVPLVFLAGGFAKASYTPNWLVRIPAWTWFYYAYDSYIKFHGTGVPLASYIEAINNGQNSPKGTQNEFTN